MEHFRRLAFVGTVGVMVVGASCSSEAESSGEIQPTYASDIRPLLERSCVHCHSRGNLAPFPLTTFAEVKPLAANIARVTREGVMPPWSARPSESCAPRLAWKDDESLSPQEIELIQRWEQGGAPEGDTAPVDGSTPARATHLESFDLELTSKAPYVASGDADEYRCFVLDPAIAEERYVSGIDFIPGNPEIVHHATVIVDHERTSLERVGPDGSFECMDDVTRGELTQILNWAPGMLPIELPSDVGIKISPNPLFVLLVHYSPKGSRLTEDRSKVQVRFGASKPAYVLETAIIGGLYAPMAGGMGLQPGPNDDGTVEFRIPVGAKDHVEKMLAPLPLPGDTTMPWLGKGRVFNIMGHAHLAATNVSGLLHKRDGRTECLLNDHWNFHWQRRYTYDARIEDMPLLEQGDMVDVSCTYDNTLDNRILSDELSRRREPLTDIGTGPTTRDEMCHVTAQVIRPND